MWPGALGVAALEFQSGLSRTRTNYTPGSGEHGNPVFNRGSGGGARGCGFEERVGVHARTGGIHFLWLLCPSVRARVS